MTLTYESIKSTLSVKLIPMKTNIQTWLAHIPYDRIGDFVVVYCAGPDGVWILTNQDVAEFGITEERFKRDALMNSLKTRPVIIQRAIDVIRELYNLPEDTLINLNTLCIAGDDKLLHVLRFGDSTYMATVPDMTYGACVLAYPGFCEQVAAVVGGDYFIIPSSVHELLIIADDGHFNTDEVEHDLRESNKTLLPPEDFLSDETLHYDFKERMLETTSAYSHRWGLQHGCINSQSSSDFTGEKQIHEFVEGNEEVGFNSISTSYWTKWNESCGPKSEVNRKQFEFSLKNEASEQLKENIHRKLRKIDDSTS